MDIDCEKFWRDGFLVIRDALSYETVIRWREAGLRSKPNQDLLSDETLAEVICEPVLVECARKILGGKPVYFGDSTVMRGTWAGNGFHKDNSDRFDANAPDWQVDRYPIIRFGIYTQPHGELPFGLDVRIGSHLHPDVTSGDMVNLAVEPGDLIVWNGRTTHSGNSKIYKITGRRMNPDPTNLYFRVFNRLGGFPWMFTSHPQERVAIFASYALASPSLDRHIDYLRQREYAVKQWQESEWSSASRAMVKKAGLDLIDVTKFRHDGRILHKDYHPISY
jgi:hypothetical protein